MLGDMPESLAAGSNTFSPKIGSAGGYEADTLWSVGVVTDFSTGVGKGLAENAIYFSTADTRRPDALLPPLPRYGRLYEMELGTDDPLPLANRAYFAESGERLFVASGNRLYEWMEPSQSFAFRLHTGMYVTSMVYFDGYLHIAGKYPDPDPEENEPIVSGERSYLWVRIDDFSYGFKTTEQTGVLNPHLFHVFGGLLYAAQGNSIYYTAGSNQESNTTYPPPPWEWEWTEPIRVGTYGEDITGIAGLIYQQLGQRYVYVSTPSWLHVILPGDVPFGVTSWPMTDKRNGVGMKSFYNRIFIPVGGDLMALQANGDLIASGVDNSPEGLPLPYSGDHFDLSSSASMPFVTILGESISSVWAGKASSWHYIGEMNRGEKVIGSHYSGNYARLFMVSQTGIMQQWYLGNTSRPTRYDTRYRFAPEGVIDTGWYAGALVEQKKYIHSIFVDAGDLHADTGVEVLYLADDEDNGDLSVPPYSEWNSLGFITPDRQEIPVGYNLSSRRVRVAVRLSTTNPRKSPSLRAIGVRYTPRLIDRNRWAFTTTLPKWELYDATRDLIAGYDQETWDDKIDSFRKRETPIRFRDLDRKWYWVLVTGASRRIYGVGYDNGQMTYDVDWSLSLTEVGKDEIPLT